MKELLNAGQVLGRSEMKKIMAGSGGCSLPCGSGFYHCCCSNGSATCTSSRCSCKIYCGEPDPCYV